MSEQRQAADAGRRHPKAPHPAPAPSRPGPGHLTCSHAPAWPLCGDVRWKLFRTAHAAAVANTANTPVLLHAPMPVIPPTFISPIPSPRSPHRPTSSCAPGPSSASAASSGQEVRSTRIW